MGFLSSLFEVPQMLHYVFLPVGLTEDEYNEMNAPLLAMVFTVGVVLGMLFFALFMVFYPFFFG
jgi:uncharacterized membrane protein YciS (DUF1049 family)